jgi:hypothetical protein
MLQPLYPPEIHWILVASVHGSSEARESSNPYYFPSVKHAHQPLCNPCCLRTQFHNFTGHGHSSGILLWRCDIMPFHALLLYSGAKMAKSVFVTSRNGQWEITAVSFMSFKKECLSIRKHVTIWSRVLSDKLTGLQLVKKFQFYGT